MRPAATDEGLGWSGSPVFLRGVAVFLVLAGAGLASLRYFGEAHGLRGLQAVPGALALGAPVAAAGVLALLSLHDRPVLLLPAAVVLWPLAFLSFAGITLPLLVPAVMMTIGYGRRSAPHRSAWYAHPGVVTTMVVGLLVLALLALLVHQDPRSYVDGTTSGSTSDVITSVEGLVSLALTTLAIVAGWMMATPGERSRVQ